MISPSAVIDITAVIISVFLSLIGVYAQHIIFTFLVPPVGNVCIAPRPVLGFPILARRKRIMGKQGVWQFVDYGFLWPTQHIWCSVVLLSKHFPLLLHSQKQDKLVKKNCIHKGAFQQALNACLLFLVMSAPTCQSSLMRGVLYIVHVQSHL